MKQHPFFLAVMMLLTIPSYAVSPECNGCCVNKGGINHCDSSAGRYVCGDGDYSSCYCTRHAVMDLQKISGCCIWQGGVLKVDPASHLVICNNGGVSEMCSIEYSRMKAVKLY